MNTKRLDRRASEEHLHGLFAELEMEFELMHLEEHQAELHREDARLAQQKARLGEDPPEAAGTKRWRHLLSKKVRSLRIEFRREILAWRQRWLASLEDALRFALLLREARAPARVQARRRR